MAEIATYLKEMNFSTRLLDLMEAIPPEKMKMLTATETSDLGLDAVDPVWDEKVVAKKASTYDVNSMEFRRRRAIVDAKCPPLPLSVEPTAARLQEQSSCEESVLWGLGLRQYQLRDKNYEAWILATFGDQAKWRSNGWSAQDISLARKCRIRFMAFGDQNCQR